MRLLGVTWGVGGVILLLTFAIYRLAPMAFELGSISLGVGHWLALAFSVVYMAWAEGYKGFHQAFAPRVVARARYLRDNPQPRLVALAPLYCMGFIYATRRRKLMSMGLTLMIICFIIIARMLPQPWRGILDSGVVVGLTLGIASILYFVVLAARYPERLTVSPEVPSEALNEVPVDT